MGRVPFKDEAQQKRIYDKAAHRGLKFASMVKLDYDNDPDVKIGLTPGQVLMQNVFKELSSINQKLENEPDANKRAHTYVDLFQYLQTISAQLVKAIRDRKV